MRLEHCSQEDHVSSRNWSKAQLMDARDAKCECGAALVMSSDGNGVVIERCQSGCFRREVPKRRPVCPECGGGPWGEKTGCEACGFDFRAKKKSA